MDTFVIEAMVLGVALVILRSLIRWFGNQLIALWQAWQHLMNPAYNEAVYPLPRVYREQRFRISLWMFAPPFGPSDLVRRAGGFHDDPLMGGTERSLEAGQCGFDEPRFEDDPYGLAVGIKFPGHPQR